MHETYRMLGKDRELELLHDAERANATTNSRRGRWPRFRSILRRRRLPETGRPTNARAEEA